jgi:polysaccharide pyruvyl transferase WcaK-like protein
MLDYGLNNIVKVTDIAFGLEPQKVEFYWNNFVAINISPLVIKENPLLTNAISYLINYIIYNTNMNVLLIPHCLVDVNNDCDSLKKVNILGCERVKIILENLSAGQYKSIIAQARFGIFARTHATIASYSSLVPTLALGYSVKSRGIAFDLDLSDYVVDIKSIKSETDLLAPFNKLIENENIIKNKLQVKIPVYVNNIVNIQFLELVGAE